MNRLIYKGKNRYREFLSAARIISRKVSKIKGVVGIAATGGIGRGYCDDYSDLDLIVYADEEKAREIKKYIAVGYLRYKDIDLDTPVVSYQKAMNYKVPSRYWSQIQRWEMGNALILFDTKGRIKNLFKEKLIFPDWEQKILLEKHRQEVGFHLKYNFETWEKRGDIINLADSLIRGTENLILWIYAKNRKFQPFIPKWLFCYIENKIVPESKYLKLIEKPYLGPVKTIKQARDIRDELLKLCSRIGLKFDYDKVDDIFKQNEKNYEKISKRTKYYLSW
ncbi:MAG: nucleotidyltransferase domain-containing protein [candidate division Zixibacteria bacterium]|nr:nucleotidyltransferase domain-containing protein [candidate division Zixibacteria bacterium]